MSKTWRDWRQELERLETIEILDPIVLGCKTLTDYINLILTVFYDYGAMCNIDPDWIPKDIRDRLEYGVFRPGEVELEHPAVIRFMKMGKGELEGFCSWTPLGKANLQKVFSPPRIRILVVDDAPVIHKLMDAWVKTQPEMEIVGHAFDAFEAEKLRIMHNPTVMTLDIHMPGKTGLEYLAEVMKSKTPTRVVLMSTIEKDQLNWSDAIFQTGVLDYIEKPRLDRFEESGREIAQVIRAVAHTDFKKLLANKRKYALDEIRGWSRSKNLILVGSSTGGVEALTLLLPQFPADCPPVLVVQHIHEGFSSAFVHRLAGVCRAKVVEAAQGMRVEPGHIYFAPGKIHLGLRWVNDELIIDLVGGPPVSRHKPSVDHLFRSAVPIASKLHVVAALLTGMGRDGADGMLKLREAGAHTIAQDEESSVVWGMPGVAVNIGAAAEVMPLEKVGMGIFKALRVIKN